MEILELILPPVQLYYARTDAPNAYAHSETARVRARPFFLVRPAPPSRRTRGGKRGAIILYIKKRLSPQNYGVRLMSSLLKRRATGRAHACASSDMCVARHLDTARVKALREQLLFYGIR